MRTSWGRRMRRGGMVAAVLALLVAGAGASAAAAQTPWAPGASVYVGGNTSVKMVIDPRTHGLYAGTLACTSSREGSSCDPPQVTPVTDGVAGPSFTAPAPLAVDPADGTLYTQGLAQPSLRRFRDGVEIEPLPLIAGAAASDVTTGTVWVTSGTITGSQLSARLVAIRGGVVTDSFPLDFRPGAIAVDSSTHAVYLLDPAQDRLVRVEDGRVVASTPVVAVATEVYVDSVRHVAYVFSPTAHAVTAVSRDGTARRDALSAGVTDVAVDSSRGEVLAVDPSTAVVSVLRGGATVQRIALEQYAPDAIATDPGGGRAYTSNLYGDIVALTASSAPAVVSVSSTGPPVTAPARPTAIVEFNVPMDRPSTAAAFTVERGGTPVPGTVSWKDDKVAVWTPSGPLPLGTVFTAAVSTAATGADGRHLAVARSWGFATTAVTVVRAGVSDDGVAYQEVPVSGPPLFVVFSTPMDEASTGAAIHVTDGSAERRDVPGRVVWFLGSTVAVFLPDARLDDASLYRLSVGGREGDTPREAGGGPLSAAWSAPFRTPGPFVHRFGPGESGGPEGVVWAWFTEPMDRASLEGRLTVSRVTQGPDYGETPVPGRVVWIGDQVSFFVPDEPYVPGASYRARVVAGAQDRQGRTLNTPVQWDFYR